jgi:hypothetical protein
VAPNGSQDDTPAFELGETQHICEPFAQVCAPTRVAVAALNGQ